MIRKFLIFIFSIVLAVLVGASVLRALDIFDAIEFFKLTGDVAKYARYALSFGPTICGLIIAGIATFKKSVSIIAFIAVAAALVGYAYVVLKAIGLLPVA